MHGIPHYSLFLLLQTCAGFAHAEQGTYACDSFTAELTTQTIFQAGPSSEHSKLAVTRTAITPLALHALPHLRIYTVRPPPASLARASPGLYFVVCLSQCCILS